MAFVEKTRHYQHDHDRHNLQLSLSLDVMVTLDIILRDPGTDCGAGGKLGQADLPDETFNRV